MQHDITTVGVDYALRNIGLCVIKWTSKGPKVVLQHVIKPKNKSVQRLLYIHTETKEILSPYAKSIVCVEGYNYQGQNLAQLGEAIGVIKIALHALRMQIVIASPASVKKFATGNSQASKEDIMQRYNIHNEHTADACAMAHIAYVYRTGHSKVRHELEVIKNMKMIKQKKKKKIKKMSKSPVHL